MHTADFCLHRSHKSQFSRPRQLFGPYGLHSAEWSGMGEEWNDMASDHWQMSYPVLSTITYLDQIGAPTLILNQTTPHGK